MFVCNFIWANYVKKVSFKMVLESSNICLEVFWSMMSDPSNLKVFFFKIQWREVNDGALID